MYNAYNIPVLASLFKKSSRNDTLRESIYFVSSVTSHARNE